jgi:hypothetical protein
VSDVAPKSACEWGSCPCCITIMNNTFPSFNSFNTSGQTIAKVQKQMLQNKSLFKLEASYTSCLLQYAPDVTVSNADSAYEFQCMQAAQTTTLFS